METFKSLFGVMRVLLPVLYCGGLVYYFLHTSGSLEDAEIIGLGPTLLGLSVVGLLFCIPLIVKIVRLIAGPRPPGGGGSNGPGAPAPDDDDGFDPDAAIARYMAQRPLEAAPASSAPSPARTGGAAKRPGFGRRNR